jgi:hypothetical protein
MNPLINKIRKTRHEANRNHVDKAVRHPMKRSRTEPERARTSAAVGAASGPKRPPHKLGQVPKALAASFSASLDGLPQTACHARRRLSHRGVKINLPEAVGRKEYHLTGASPQ